MCSSVEPDIEESSEQYISPHYQNFVNLKGMNAVHQKIQSLQAKIDQLRILFHDLKPGIALVTTTAVSCPISVTILTVNSSVKSIFRCFNFSPLIDSPTRSTQASQFLIDLSAVNRPQNIRAHGVISSHLIMSDTTLFTVSANSIGYVHQDRQELSGTMQIIAKVNFAKN